MDRDEGWGERAFPKRGLEAQWTREDDFYRIPGCDRRLIERELWRCLTALETYFPERSPHTVRHLLRTALERELEDSEAEGD